MQSSETERTAMEAERAVDDLKMTEYMAGRVGEEYDGVISGVHGVRHIRGAAEPHRGAHPHDRTAGRLLRRGQEDLQSDRPPHGSSRLSLGDKMTVRVASVDVDARQINFVPARMIQ